MGGGIIRLSDSSPGASIKKRMLHKSRKPAPVDVLARINGMFDELGHDLKDRHRVDALPLLQ